MDHIRQSRDCELLSEKGRILSATSIGFEKFRKYMADRDEREEKHILHGQALSTLDVIKSLEKWGLLVPKQMKDLLIAKEARFKADAEAVVVEIITESDIIPKSLPSITDQSMSPPRNRYSTSETGKHVQVTPYPPKEPSVGPKLMAYAISAHCSVSLGAVDRVYSVEESPQRDEGGRRSTRVGEKVLTSDVEGDSLTREDAEDGST
ncbi:hypothetical protein Bca4012_026681 [Brassica carinata]